MKRAFTIIELLMVIAIIGILTGLSTVAVTGAIQKGRIEKGTACVSLINQGAAAYYAQNGRWPGPVGTKVESGSSFNLPTGVEYYTLTASEVRQTVKAMVDEARMGRPVMDISGLYVSRIAEETNRKAFGVDFMEAIRGSPRNQKKMTSSEMHFGYPERQHGYFRRFRVYYYPESDRLVFAKASGD